MVTIKQRIIDEVESAVAFNKANNNGVFNGVNCTESEWKASAIKYRLRQAYAINSYKNKFNVWNNK